jgi:secreted protein with Ig-like and vWFA domain
LEQQSQSLKVGLQGKNIPTDNLPASNLVFLVDVSGSMNDQNKLPLLKQSMKILVEQLRKKDKVSIVVYAGAAGLVLPPLQVMIKNHYRCIRKFASRRKHSWWRRN